MSPRKTQLPLPSPGGSKVQLLERSPEGNRDLKVEALRIVGQPRRVKLAQGSLHDKKPIVHNSLEKSPANRKQVQNADLCIHQNKVWSN